MITPAAILDPAPAEPFGPESTRTWSQRRLLSAIDFYQRAREGRPSPCRFHPSCSSYARESLAVHGAGRGSWLAVRRLLRCRPFGPSGFDPVPPPGGASGSSRASDEMPRTLATRPARHLTVAIPTGEQKG